MKRDQAEPRQPASLELLCKLQQRQLQELREGLQRSRDELSQLASRLASLEAGQRDITAACFQVLHPRGPVDKPRPGRAETTPARTDTGVLSLKSSRGANAQGVLTKGGLLVLKGSVASKTTVPSLPASPALLREKLLADRVVKRTREGWLFQEDHLFATASTAASVIMGRAVNGLQAWRSQDGRALGEVQRR
jgi:hypothetical protein